VLATKRVRWFNVRCIGREAAGPLPRAWEQHAELKLKELSRSKERLEPSAAVERLERFAPATIFPKL
jgi:hypothetical protein